MFKHTGFQTAGTGSSYGLNFGSRFDISSVSNLSYMFASEYYNSSYTPNAIRSINLSGWLTSRSETPGLSTNFSYMFHECKNLTSVNFGDDFYVENATNMSNMFYDCTALRDLYFGKNFKPQKVTNFANMFYNCTALVGVDFTYFQTRDASDMSYMFYNCYNFTSLDLRAFNTERVTSFSNMFAVDSAVISRLAALTLGFNTANALNMSRMFAYCSGLTSLDLSSFTTNKLEKIGGMFAECYRLKTICLKWISTDIALH